MDNILTNERFLKMHVHLKEPTSDGMIIFMLLRPLQAAFRILLAMHAIVVLIQF